MNKYGQVEPNHLSAQRNGQIYAQLPAAIDLENGMFAKYDYVNKAVNVTGEGEWMLVYNEVKVYDSRESYADFYLKAGQTPRLFKTAIGDIFTTDKVAGGVDALAEGDKLTPVAGILTKDGAGDMKWVVVKKYTMPNGDAGVKLQRIQ
jgi:hypothetical protein